MVLNCNSPSLETDEEIDYVRWYVRICALVHALDLRVTSACVCFLELCGIDSQEIRVDLESVRRIYYNYSPQVIESGSDLEEVAVALPSDSKEKLKAIIDLFVLQ